MDKIKREKLLKEAEDAAHKEIAEDEMKKSRAISSSIVQKQGNNSSNSSVPSFNQLRQTNSTTVAQT